MERFEALRGTLTEHFPQWERFIAGVPIEAADSIPRPGSAEFSRPRPASTDGRRILVNDRLMEPMSPELQCFYAARELLHIRLSHVSRREERVPWIWQTAADAVVNAMLRDEGFELPSGVLLPPGDSAPSAEELYEVYLNTPPKTPPEQPVPVPKKGNPDKKGGKLTAGSRREIDDPGLAAAVQGLASELEPSLQTDFDWFPGDTVRDGMLPWSFRAYPVACAEILLDTSASVDAALLRAFVRGVKALLREDARIRVGCFDTRFYGFREIRSDGDIDRLELRGSGGTNFTVAVDAFTGDAENRIIFTDGCAEMPEKRCDCIWVVYGDNAIHPHGGRVIYARPPAEQEKPEIDFLIT